MQHPVLFILGVAVTTIFVNLLWHACKPKRKIFHAPPTAPTKEPAARNEAENSK
jgi:hypothetical protein